MGGQSGKLRISHRGGGVGQDPKTLTFKKLRLRIRAAGLPIEGERPIKNLGDQPNG